MDVVGRHDRARNDDVASADELGDAAVATKTTTGGPSTPPLNLAPRVAPVIHGRRGTGARRWPWYLVLVVIVGGIGFVISHAISDATLFFLNADEAVAKQGELGPKNFRLQGTVVPGSTHRTSQGVAFSVTFNGVDVPVNHVGDPPELFQDHIPVVLQGHWSSSVPGTAFSSDLILVKHSENYEAKNPDRVKQAEQGGKTPGSAPIAGSPARP